MKLKSFEEPSQPSGVEPSAGSTTPDRRWTTWPRKYFNQIAGPYRSLLDKRSREVDDFIKASGDVLAPFGEPLTHIDRSFLRCVFREHENSFSDWLAYILGQMKCGEIEDILGITDFLSEKDRSGIPKGVYREFWVKSGHKDRSGLLDVLVVCSENPNSRVFCIEIKKGAPADPEKQRGYYDSLTDLGFDPRCVLLVTSASEKIVENFEVLLWRDLTIRLRRWVAARGGNSSVSHTFLALVLAFVANVERNLQGLSLAGGNTSAETVAYLKEFVGEKAMCNDMQCKQQGDVISPEIELLRLSLSQYGLAAGAIFEVQSIVSEVLRHVLDDCGDRMKELWKLESKPTVSKPQVFPNLELIWNVPCAQIAARTEIGPPIGATLWLFLSCPRDPDDNSNMTLTVGLEGCTQSCRSKIAERLGDLQGRFDEVWEKPAVGLYRQIKPIDDLKKEASKLLEDFLVQLGGSPCPI